MSRFIDDGSGIMVEPSVELYDYFKVTNYGFGIRRVQYSPMLSQMEEWVPEKRHYYGRMDFFGEDSAVECGKRCEAEALKKRQEEAAK